MSRKTIRRLVLFIALLFLVGVFVFNHFRMAANENAMKAPPPAAPPQASMVAVVAATPGTHRALIRGVGSAEARFELALNARISGQVTNVSHLFDSGHRVAKGTVLATLEDSQWQQELAEALNTEAAARVSYLEEQQEYRQAKQEWESSGLEGAPLSPLVLREPQLESARTELDSALREVAAARKNLASTRIEAPFDAIVVSRSIAPGSYVSAGSEIGELMSADAVEISIPLSASDWSALPDPQELTSGNYQVSLLQVETGQQWTGVVSRSEQNLNSETRQRSLVVTVATPLDQEPPLYPGTFLQASIPGREVENIWQLPASALSQRGEIWTLNEDNRLVSHNAQVLFSDQQHIYVTPPVQSAGETLVVIQPLSNYLEGMAMKPVQEQSHD